MHQFDPDLEQPPRKLFTLEEALHFTRGFTNRPFTGSRGFKGFLNESRWDNVIVAEGDPEFDLLRDEILRNSERGLFLAISNYRRGLDLLSSASAMWAQVTMYYASYYAATSILGLFGAVVDAPVRAILVGQGKPTHQELVSYVWTDFSPTRGESHRRFWETYYQLVSPLRDFLGPAASDAIEPFKDLRTWQIEQRNLVNYDSRIALDLGLAFRTDFDPARFPESLPGSLRIQHLLTKATTDLALRLFHSCGLDTGHMREILPGANLVSLLEEYVGRTASAFPPSRPLLLGTTPEDPPPRLY